MEAVIMINGHPLTEAQAMTIRVALEVFTNVLQTTWYGDDSTGRAVTAGYWARMDEIRHYIFAP